MHILLYKAAVLYARQHKIELSTDFLSPLLNELAVLFPLVEHNSRSRLGSVVTQRIDDDINRWLEVAQTESSKSIPKVAAGTRDSGMFSLEYLRLYGIHAKPPVHQVT